ncbi:ABC transporter ATP-binding protein [Limosilactobacillus fermentum]|uniref:Putative hemin import ATP-binding protein HrtA n=1 Tax=Limosilactobacillus fermentum TaxID=1613 RepID=A0ABD0AKL7_LIMFE|nr:ABC transporter ATP-binding protein [Limosilactobacillus fermentum]MBD9348404.1 ABC transporter ATP-binding protein [Limosilactobacillus fermentum]PHI34311.1 peptide ABC transporter ATP-binding protein [Limosilactobacillus fermentum]UVW02872.1 ABC transporter ATP-binding protein [Limosilactobacillus fermentum]WEN05339.1 ABC transporter ATP-binding protein [Limosilactobacillus fermentum]WEN12193.1 ABC transporter ATP-binding protein [Limosilactobacillus fermentum]
MTAIELRNVEKYYGQGIARVHVLSDVNFKAELGKLNLVIGPSGSGKSTFLTIAGGLQQPSEGQVLIDGQEISALSGKQRDRLRLDKIGFVLQSYNLLPYLTVGDQFALVDRMRHGNLSKGELGDLLKDLGIEKLIHKYPGELSGGQNQRVAIARALYTDPQIILADEPTAALDSDRVKVVGQLFSDLAVKHNKAVVVVTHDLRLREFADQVYTIVDGQMAKEERPLGTSA